MKSTFASTRISLFSVGQRLILVLAIAGLPAIVCRGEPRFVRLSYPGVETILDGDVDINDKYILAGAPDYANRFGRIGAAMLFDAATHEPLHLLERGAAPTNDEFGDAVALGKNLAYVAAPFSHGSVTAFDLATGQRRWTAGTNVINTYFGEALAAGDDFVVASAPKFNDSHGRLHVLSASTGSEIRTVVSPASGDRQFGYALAMHGSLVLAGAPGRSFLSAGDAYLYDVASDKFLAHFHPDDLTPSAQFGHSVDLSDKYALIGASDGFDFPPYNGPGAAYVYDATTHELLHKLQPSDGNDFDSFGMSVAISGDLGLIASRSHRGAYSAGSLYVFDLITGEQLAKFESPNVHMYSFFGLRMATHGTRAVVASFQTEQPVVLLDVRELVPEPAAIALVLPAGIVGMLRRRRTPGLSDAAGDR